MVSEDMDNTVVDVNDSEVKDALVKLSKGCDRAGYVENDALEKQEMIDSKNGEPAIVWAGGDDEKRESNVTIAETKRKFDVRCLFIGLMVTLMLIGTAAIAILAHKFHDTHYEFRFASHFDNNMVLQRSPHRAVIWGYASFVPENATIILELQSDSIKKVYYSSLHNTDVGLMWMVRLDERNETTPFKVSASIDHPTSSSKKIELYNVAFGDVWICAGTELPENASNEYHFADHDSSDLRNSGDLRVMTLNPSRSDMPWSTIRNLRHSWSLSTTNGILSEMSAICLTFAKRLSERVNHPVGLISALHSSSFIHEWSPPHVVEACEIDSSQNHKVGQIWNAMINPLLGISTHGVIWYQGEMDAEENTHNYNCSLVELINHWGNRSNEQGQTLFAIIQLIPRSFAKRPYRYADLRWEQTANFGFLPNKLLPNAILVPSVDLPATTPRGQRKEVLAERLLKELLKYDNQTNVKPFIPTRYSINSDNHSLVLFFDNSLIRTKSKAGFEVCCSENPSSSCSSSFIKVSYAPGREWVSSPIVESLGNVLVIDTDGCEFYVVGLRYLWDESPCEHLSCPVYDGDSDSPLSPFIRFDMKNDTFIHDLLQTQVHPI